MKQVGFIDTLSELLLHLDFDEQAKVESLKYISTNYSYISKISDEAYLGDNEEYSIKKRNRYTRLMILIYKMVKLKNIYDEKGLPEEVFYDTLSDVTLRQRLYLKEHGRLGLNDEDIMWLKHIYELNIFKLGSLQFEIAHMEYLTWKGLVYFNEALKKLPEGKPTLNVHILRGVDLSKDEIDKSFERAEIFFAKYFPKHNFVAYTCNSWLLYSGNKNILSTSSNILDFARRFEAIGESNSSDMAIQYIFGKKHREKKDYPQETSLQVNALRDFKILGVGCGIIYRKDTN
ncbi:acyltransferase domain-containing protein [Clostridium sp.]|uniref:acyltransferase domain-containing protein n=1 Tax=Clostridium sp. TaxID=1506 RepID=UPI003217C604